MMNSDWEILLFEIKTQEFISHLRSRASQDPSFQHLPIQQQTDLGSVLFKKNRFFDGKKLDYGLWLPESFRARDQDNSNPQLRMKKSIMAGAKNPSIDICPLRDGYLDASIQDLILMNIYPGIMINMNIVGYIYVYLIYTDPLSKCRKI